MSPLSLPQCTQEAALLFLSQSTGGSPPDYFAGQLQLEFGINIYLKIGVSFYFSQAIAWFKFDTETIPLDALKQKGFWGLSEVF